MIFRIVSSNQYRKGYLDIECYTFSRASKLMCEIPRRKYSDIMLYDWETGEILKIKYHQNSDLADFVSARYKELKRQSLSQIRRRGAR